MGAEAQEVDASPSAALTEPGRVPLANWPRHTQSDPDGKAAIREQPACAQSGSLSRDCCRRREARACGFLLSPLVHGSGFL